MKAGFTRDQIAAMQAPAASADPPSAPVLAEPPAPAPTTAPAEPPAPPKPHGIEDLSQMLSAEFAKLNDAIVKANLQQAQQPPQESVDDILASIINPPQKSSGTPFSFKEVKS